LGGGSDSHQIGEDLADQILEGLPRPSTFGELLARLNRDMAQLNAHYGNSQWLTEMGEALETITVDQMTLTLDVADRRFRVDPGKLLGIQHLGQIAEFLQEVETATGMDKIIAVAESVREIYDLAFPREGAPEPENADASQGLQQMQPTKAGK
jgi:hypothetical protein